MRQFSLVTVGLLAFASLACSGAPHVNTLVSPDARLSSIHSFRVLEAPRPRDGSRRTDAYDPMVNNSIANRSLREAITLALVERGYAAVESDADVHVAVYASAREKLDVELWDYGYPYWPRWRRLPSHAVTSEYTEGTVVVDMISPSSRELLWRGSATARLSDEPSEDVERLAKVARAIVAKFPRASMRPIAQRGGT